MGWFIVILWLMIGNAMGLAFLMDIYHTKDKITVQNLWWCIVICSLFGMITFFFGWACFITEHCSSGFWKRTIILKKEKVSHPEPISENYPYM